MWCVCVCVCGVQCVTHLLLCTSLYVPICFFYTSDKDHSVAVHDAGVLCRHAIPQDHHSRSSRQSKHPDHLNVPQRVSACIRQGLLPALVLGSTPRGNHRIRTAAKAPAECIAGSRRQAQGERGRCLRRAGSKAPARITHRGRRIPGLSRRRIAAL